MYEERRIEEKDRQSDIEFLTRLNVTLTSDHDYRSNMIKALKMIGNYCQNDRIQIIKIYPDMTFSILYEWCNRSIPPVKDKIKKHKCFLEKELENQLNTHNFIRIENTSLLQCEELRGFLNACNTQSSLLFPLFTPHIFSFLAFSQCVCRDTRPEPDIDLLGLFSAIIAANMEKNSMISRLMQKLSTGCLTSPITPPSQLY